MSTPQILNAFSAPTQRKTLNEQGFRQFEVVNADYVLTPGLIEIDTLLLNGVLIPPYQDHTVPVDSTDKNFKTIRTPLYQVAENHNSQAVILRSLQSNDGKWQIGSVIAVKGTWQGDTPVPAIPEPEKKDEQEALETLTSAQLRARAKAMGLPDFPPVYANAKIIEAIRAELAK